MEARPDLIFDLKTELPPATDEAQIQLITQLDEMARKVSQYIKAGGELSEEDTRAILVLIPEVVDCARAGVILGFILLMLKEFPAMRDLYKELAEKHGELPPFLYFRAQAESELGNRNTALGLYQQLVVQGIKNYWVFMDTAKIQFQMGMFQESIASLNLAVYENESQFAEPFEWLAKNFHSIGEIEKMLECFSRIEKIAGADALKNLGPLFEAHREMYGNVKKFMGR